MSEKSTPFFIGFLPVPDGLRGFLMVACAGLVIAFTALAYMIGTTQADPGPAQFRFDLGAQTLTGTMTALPYPVLHVTNGTETVAAGRSILLSANGKNGVQSRIEDGAVVTASGPLLQRGTLDMMQVRGGRRGIKAEPDVTAIEVVSESLGRWQMAGEICDGKCLTGAMRPGRGIAHRACANLCISGGVPPVFVSAQPVEGEEFFLVGDSDGNPIGPDLTEFTALYIQVEGEVRKLGDMHMFLMDVDTIKVLP